jgi:RNA polymerase sigma-70 factor (ECF subfamily)
MSEVIEVERIDTDLVHRAQLGDGQAITDLLRLSQPLVQRIVVRRYWDYQMVDDLTQSSLLVVVTELSALRAPEAYISWLQCIVRNVCCKEARRNSCLQAAAARLVQQHRIGVDAFVAQVDPEDVTLRAEIQSHLRTAVTSLPARYRAALVMRAMQGQTFDEIGATLGCPRQLARLWYFRARRRLQHSCAADEVLASATASYTAA